MMIFLGLYFSRVSLVNAFPNDPVPPVIRIFLLVSMVIRRNRLCENSIIREIKHLINHDYAKRLCCPVEGATQLLM